ncbi:MAG: hypothetical protein AAF702_32715 [Chloroflexota bacterium]
MKPRPILLLLLLLYLSLALFQISLPGLHYDEAKEAGVNAMELLTGQPVTAFRGATLHVGSWSLPLMVQDYIGAINVYLALPFLKLTGIGVPNLRALSVLIGLLTLVAAERSLSTWVALHAQRHDRLHNQIHNRQNESVQPERVPISLAGLLAVALLTASPSFLFWSRQGIFVTNIVQPLCFGTIWMSLAWLHNGRGRALLWAALWAGMALYAKLIAIWVIGPFTLLLASWVWLNRSIIPNGSSLLRLGGTAGIVFALPLLPIMLFNLQSGGTFTALLTNAGESYYGVNNLDIGKNLLIRWVQLRQVLVGNQFWYLGGPFGNAVAPYIASVSLLLGLWMQWRQMMGWFLLTVGAFLMSLFTISDLFVTHYALLHPLLVCGVALGLATLAAHRNLVVADKSRFLRLWDAIPISIVACWLVFDLTATLRYHQALNETGGLADHSDATYHLAYHLRYNGLGAPIVLDWGMDAPIRFLSQGTVRPIEIFGYDSPLAPDEGFVERVGVFLDNPHNVYLLHASNATVFAGRREQFLALAKERGLLAQQEATFAQRNGIPLFELWRVQAE